MIFQVEVFWVVMLCSVVGYQRFRGLSLHGITTQKTLS